MITKSIRFLFLVLFFLTPYVFTSQNSELFELPKMYFVYTLTLLILIFHLVNHLRGHVPFFRSTFLKWPLFIFLFFQTVSAFFSVDIHTSIFGYYSRLNGGLLSLFSYALLYSLLVIYLSDHFRNRIINTFLISGFFVAVYGIAQHFGIDKNIWIQDVQNRVFSTLGQPNWLAAYLCILLPFSLDAFLTSSRLIHKSYFLLLTSSYYLCLLFTKSKSGIIAAIISLGIYFIFRFLSDLKNKVLFIHRKSYFIILSFIFLSLFVSNPIKDYLFPPKTSTIQNLSSNILITPSQDIRKIVWQGSIALWKQFPLFGTGPETFAYTYYWTRPAAHNLTSEWDFLYNKAHNEYLNYLATTGSFGFLSYLLLIIVSLISFLRRRQFAALAAYISILVTNFAGFSVVITSLYFFLLSAFIVKPNQNPPQSSFLLKIFSIFLIINSSFLIINCLYYYLADITYAQADTLDANHQYSPALAQINLSLGYRGNEPVFLLKKAEIMSKLALDSNSDADVSKITGSLDLATQISPFNLNLWKQKAQVYYYLSTIDSKYYLLALDALTKATLLAPTDVKSFYMLGQFYENIKEYDAAIKYYGQAIKLKSNYDHAYFALGKIYFDQKKYDLALPLFESTLKFAPTNPDAKNYLNLISTASAGKK